MKILLVNKFFYLKGGAERAFFDTAELLKRKGHEILSFSMKHPNNKESSFSNYFVSPVDFNQISGFGNKIKAAGRILYSVESQKKISELMEYKRPGLVHLHNIHSQISPSILFAIKKYNLPVVMTLHDYKLACPVYTFFRDQKPCEKCSGQHYYHCLIHKCSKSSYFKSLLNTLEMYLHHQLLHIYGLVDAFICPSRFLYEKISETGYQFKSHYLPNFIHFDKYVPSYTWEDKTLVYFGRLSEEKGLSTLCEAAKGLDIKVKIIGDGPLKHDLEKKVSQENIKNIIFTGYQKGRHLYDHIKNSMAAVLPSLWYENNPRMILESFALGKPVIGSRIGGIPELVMDEKTGFTFKPGDAQDLRDKILYLTKNPVRIKQMGRHSRQWAERHFQPEIHFKKLMRIYKTVQKNTSL
ncbi:MAG: glycosyltransferase [Candidatus Aminicenantes bacterium]|nr:glycosyltransferase [Candidatus Aminicenantes bacterium]